MFNPKKYQLVHFAPKRRAGRYELDRLLRLELASGQVQEVKAKPTGEYLGVILDSYLEGKQHLVKIKEKATRQIGALSRIGQSTWGVHVEDMRQLVISTLLPKMLYACTTWFVPDGGLGYKTREDYVLKRLGALQHKALVAVSGAFRTTAKAALEVDLNMLPIELLLYKTITVSLLRIRATPLWQNIKDIRDTAPVSRRTAVFRSPLHKLECLVADKLGKKILSTLEEQVPATAVVPPWQVPPAIHVAPDREQAIQEHNEVLANIAAEEQDSDGLTMEKEQLVVYTNGSEIGSEVGSAVVAPKHR